jgi:Flp pilus assembly protein TadD
MLFFILIFASANLMASPFKPQDHEVILELLPQQTLSNTQKLQQQFNKNPDNLFLAIELANKYIKLGYQGYAQAVLKKWWNLENIPISVLLVRINLYQKQHKFNQALQDLTKLLTIDKNNTQALLTRAFIYRTQGKYAQALDDCRSLAKLSYAIIATICHSSIISLQGEAKLAYKNLQKLTIEDSMLKQWILTEMAQIAERLGDNIQAEKHFSEAVKIKNQDYYLYNSYADFLIWNNKSKKLLELFENLAKNNFALRLRILIARKKLNISSEQDIKYLQTNFDIEKARNSTLHLAEQARFLLTIEYDLSHAFELAKENWTIQKEPLDAIIYLQLALANNKSIPNVVNWIQQNKLEDVRIQSLLEKFE